MLSDPKDLFVRCKFRDSQLQAMREIYKKHFAPHMTAPYRGFAVVAIWERGGKWETSKGLDSHHTSPGFFSETCRDDPLWQEFSDLLPYMAQSASITKINPGAVMIPHIDRWWRPEAIYFPIEGCTEDCISEYYDLPKLNNRINQSQVEFPPAAHNYSVTDNAVLTNVHEWHGVRNNSNHERIAVGWNFKSRSMSYTKCRQILSDLGYLE